jgi:carbon monoxide dehydrogenase subunit G
MARFVDSVPASWSPEDAFSYMADVTNFAEWDPGTQRVVQVEGSGPGVDAAYDVTVDLGKRTSTFRYDVVEWQPPHRVVLSASNAVMHLRDEIVLDRIEVETLITYDARITLRGPLKMFDGWLERRFRPMGERAAAGLRERVQRPR